MSVDFSIQEFILKIINGGIAGLPSLLKYAKGMELERIRELEKMITQTLDK